LEWWDINYIDYELNPDEWTPEIRETITIHQIGIIRVSPSINIFYWLSIYDMISTTTNRTEVLNGTK